MPPKCRGISCEANNEYGLVGLYYSCTRLARFGLIRAKGSRINPSDICLHPSIISFPNYQRLSDPRGRSRIPTIPPHHHPTPPVQSLKNTSISQTALLPPEKPLLLPLSPTAGDSTVKQCLTITQPRSRIMYTISVCWR